MKTRIIWAGDSTVKTNRIDTYPLTGIGQAFRLFVKPEVEILNFAENGRSTRSFIKEGRLEEIKGLIQKDDFFFIQFGHNDQKEDGERRTEPFSTYQQYLKEYIHCAQKVGAYPVLITSISRRLYMEDGKIEESHGDYPEAMKSLGRELGIPVMDLTYTSKNLLESTPAEITKSWFMNLEPGRFKNYPEGLMDNTHLQYEGAVKMAGLLEEELRKEGGIYRELLVR